MKKHLASVVLVSTIIFAACKQDPYELTTTVYQINGIELSSVDYSGTAMTFSNQSNASSLVLFLDFTYSEINETVRYLDQDPGQESARAGQFPYEIEQRIFDINLYIKKKNDADSSYQRIEENLFDVDGLFIAQEEFLAISQLNSIMFGEEIDLFEAKGKLPLDIPFEPHLLIYPNENIQNNEDGNYTFKMEVIVSSINGPYELDTLSNYCDVEIL